MQMLAPLMIVLLLVSPPECPPAAVELSEFTAIRASGATYVRWETASELNNLGFNIYGTYYPFTDRRKLNDELLPSFSPGAGMGAEYEFVDFFNHEFFWLESVDANGETTLYGPVRTDHAVRRTLTRTRLPVRTFQR
jgi:hypothetical protein